MQIQDPETPQADGPVPVKVTSLTMPFLDMVVFMVKWALASIPAFVILTVAVGLCWVVGLRGCMERGRSEDPAPAWLKKR